MKVLDTLESTDARVTVVDLKAGNLSLSLDTFDRIGVLEAARNGQFNLGLFHVVGSSIASLEEISEVAKYVNDMEYIVARNAVNDTNFFEWDQKTYKKYFSRLNSAHEIDIPKLNEMAYEQVDLAGLTFKDFIDNKGQRQFGRQALLRAARLCAQMVQRPRSGTGAAEADPGADRRQADCHGGLRLR
jgi:hypothetical protein